MGDDDAKVARLDYLKNLRADLAKLKEMADMVKRREKRKALSQEIVQGATVQAVLLEKVGKLRMAFEKIVA
jgi:hypothetical protein